MGGGLHLQAMQVPSFTVVGVTVVVHELHGMCA
jgi:hypothetical protein